MLCYTFEKGALTPGIAWNKSEKRVACPQARPAKYVYVDRDDPPEIDGNLIQQATLGNYGGQPMLQGNAEKAEGALVRIIVPRVETLRNNPSLWTRLKGDGPSWVHGILRDKDLRGNPCWEVDAIWHLHPSSLQRLFHRDPDSLSKRFDNVLFCDAAGRMHVLGWEEFQEQCIQLPSAVPA